MKNNCKNWFKDCTVVSALLFVLPLIVFGETGIGEKVFSIGPRATYSDPKDADKGQWYGGAQGRLHFSSSLALEASIDYRSNDFSNHVTIKSYPVLASLLVYLMPGAGWSPFLLGGGGWYYTKTEVPGSSKTDYRFGLHAGAGLEIMLTESLSIDGTYRYIWLESVKTKNAGELHKTFEDSGPMVTIAFNILF